MNSQPATMQTATRSTPASHRPGGLTITQSQHAHRPTVALPQAGVLRLRAATTSDRHVQWAEDVVNNENMGKKSSKVCCIYHKPRNPNDSSSDDSDSSESDFSDSDDDNSSARPPSRRVGGPHNHDHHGHGHGHDHGGDGAGGSAKGKGKQRRPSPNAYEKMPKYGKGNSKPGESA
ncbi:hypothetical protein K402DRAFT_392341 [Aulographum hederae CBS 113979]|uniref:Type 1 phosphatases regulator n=1 Tax=Aulographum hederae CBS 113979 TaxID=1176131 RepID=A0A6G1H533_9PEZI|nr:hypothetical protein K402DRAFT_392341 [Aulographum hederae CBS 113979]